MAQPPNPFASNPKAAARKRSALDAVLDPVFFKSLGEPTRVKLLTCLIKCGRPCSVSEISECSSVDLSVVSRHLGHLARAGLVKAEKHGRTTWYAPCCEELIDRLVIMIEAIEQWCPNCGADGSVRPDAGRCCDGDSCGCG